jgi:hypothetical protein
MFRFELHAMQELPVSCHVAFTARPEHMCMLSQHAVFLIIDPTTSQKFETPYRPKRPP